jgi:hypothetical protein
MKTVLKNIALLTTLFSIAPAHTKQVSRQTTAQPAPIIPKPIQPAPSQPVIPIIPAPVQPIIVQPQSLTNTWTSSAGLVYKSGPKLPNRINHVLAHAKADPKKANHTVFSVPEDQILDLVDEAWRNKGNPQVNPNGKGDIYIINMGKVIGTKGETKIQINTFQGTPEIISAYPVQ